MSADCAFHNILRKELDDELTNADLTALISRLLHEGERIDGGTLQHGFLFLYQLLSRRLHVASLLPERNGAPLDTHLLASLLACFFEDTAYDPDVGAEATAAAADVEATVAAADAEATADAASKATGLSSLRNLIVLLCHNCALLKADDAGQPVLDALK